MRILLFLGTNIAVLVLISIIFNLLGLEGILANNGVDLNLGSLLIFCALFGMSGSLISLFLSKFMAKRGTGKQIIETPRNRDEQGLPHDLPGEMTAFGIRSQTGSGFAALLRSHPPLDERILALQTA